MDIEKQVESLVIAADRKSLGLPNSVAAPNNSENPKKILESTLQKYAPVFPLRCASLAWEYAYHSYTQKHTEVSKNVQPVSFQMFQYRCTTNFENHKLYVQALEYVSTFLPETVSLAYVGLDGSGAGTVKSIG
jgi:hypothetical protein